MSAETGVIHDIGYRRYTGPRLGRAQIIRALYWHSLRSAFGFGRGAKAKIVPWIAFVIMCLPAVANAVVVANGGTRIVPYDTYVMQLRIVVMIIFIAAQAPELVSRDIRSHVLPLYFCRPLRRLDYPLAKVAAFVTACLVLIEIPLLRPFRVSFGTSTGKQCVLARVRLDGVDGWGECVADDGFPGFSGEWAAGVEQLKNDTSLRSD